MHRHRFGVALSSVSGEDKSPLNITAGRTHEGAVLVARDRHDVVLHYVHQVHLCAARKTTHRAYSIERRSVGAVMMASSRCKAGYPQLVHRRRDNLGRLLFPCHNWPAASLDHLVGNRGMLVHPHGRLQTVAGNSFEHEEQAVIGCRRSKVTWVPRFERC
jgi:hypothetical protein